ncbi:hypothetical protein [Nocardia neocaledoniensis]|uniref:hypothetical protein n=1 Tax=Nocardia neocaledoniensis TaxID=236511 RepID=UPI0024558FE2|nr:hypothetical protein [Nocardia neocaledoniensis]
MTALPAPDDEDNLPAVPRELAGPSVFTDRAAASARLDVIVQDLRAYGIVRDDIATAFVRARIPGVDTALLPADLAERVTRRETHPTLRDHRKRAVPVLWNICGTLLLGLGSITLLCLAVVVVGAFVAAAPGAIDFASPSADAPDFALLLRGLLTGSLAIAAGTAVHRVAARLHPLALTADEVAQADRALVRWPRTYDDGAWWSERLDSTQRDTVRRELLEATATTRWPEARVVGIANLLATSIRTSPAYRHDDLDPLRLDLDRLVRDISLRAHRIWLVRTRGSAPASPVVAEALRERREMESAASDAAWISLIGLLDAMTSYRKELARIELLLDDIAALDRAAAHDLDATVAQLLRDAAGNELDTDQLTRHTEQLAELRAGLDIRLTVLRELVDNATMPILTTDSPH